METICIICVSQSTFQAKDNVFRNNTPTVSLYFPVDDDCPRLTFFFFQAKFCLILSKLTVQSNTTRHRTKTRGENFMVQFWIDCKPISEDLYWEQHCKRNLISRWKPCENVSQAGFHDVFTWLLAHPLFFAEIRTESREKKHVRYINVKVLKVFHVKTCATEEIECFHLFLPWRYWYSN